ncbi:MAG: putative PEP-CTERM system TPR-repeat lipoprotein [Motiliproteus sp.]|jgi:putative PEP-CTERM system TPR-repeat lipoprotein
MDADRTRTIYSNQARFKISSLCLLLAFLPASGNTEAATTDSLQQAREYRDQGRPKSAIIEAKNAILENPSSPEARLMLGELYLKIGDPRSAEKSLEKAHQLDGSSSLIRLSYAKTLLQLNQHDKLNTLLGDYALLPENIQVAMLCINAQAALSEGDKDRARSLMEQAAKIDPDHPSVLLLQALFASQKDELNQAAALLNRILESNPEHAEALLLKGEIALYNGQHREALEVFEKASAIQYSNLALSTYPVRALIADNRLDEAQARLRPLLEAAPDYPFANQLQASISLQKKDYVTALRHAEKVLNQLPDHLPSTYIAALAAYSLERFERAYSYINDVVNTAPRYAAALKLQAATQIKLGLTDEAQKTLTKIDINALQPQDASLFVAAGTAALQRKHYQQSQQLFRQAVALAPDDELINLHQASVHLALGDTEAGIAELERAVEKAPESQTVQMALILSYLKDQQLDKALTAALAFQQQHPGSPYGFSLEGLARVFQQQPEAAETAFRQALSLDPGDLNAGHNLAALARNQQDPEQARHLYQQLLEHHPDDLKTLMLLFELDGQLGQSEAAILWLKQAVDKHPQALRPNLLLGHIYLGQKQPARALELSERIRPRHPHDPALLALIGRAQSQTGQNAEAIKTYRQLERIIPEQRLPHSKLAELYEKAGRVDLAQESVDRALAIDPEHLPSLLTLGRIKLKSGNLAAASQIKDQLRELAPDNSWVNELAAQIAMAQGKPAEAVELYRRVLEQRETNIIRIQLASALWSLGERDQAIETLTHWLEQYPEDLLTLDTLANLYLVNGQLPESKTVFTEIISLLPDHPQARNNLAWLLLKEGNLDQALVHAQHARQLDPNSADILDTLGSILLEKGDSRAAEKLLAKAIDLAPQDLEIQFNLARAQVQSGQRREARERLQRILDPGNTDIHFGSREAARRLLDSLDSSET